MEKSPKTNQSQQLNCHYQNKKNYSGAFLFLSALYVVILIFKVIIIIEGIFSFRSSMFYFEILNYFILS